MVLLSHATFVGDVSAVCCKFHLMRYCYGSLGALHLVLHSRVCCIIALCAGFMCLSKAICYLQALLHTLHKLHRRFAPLASRRHFAQANYSTSAIDGRSPS